MSKILWYAERGALRFEFREDEGTREVWLEVFLDPPSHGEPLPLESARNLEDWLGQCRRALEARHLMRKEL